MVTFNIVCPRCQKVSKATGTDRWRNPRVNCGDWIETPEIDEDDDEEADDE